MYDATKYAGKTIAEMTDSAFAGYPAGSMTIKFTDGTVLKVQIGDVNYGHGDTGSCLQFQESTTNG